MWPVFLRFTLVNFDVVSCDGNSGNMKGKFYYSKLIFTILKPGFIGLI